LKNNLPSLLKQRLEYELFRMERIKQNYTIEEEAARNTLFSEIKNFTDEEFKILIKNKVLDYAYINGNIHFENRFLSNLFFYSEAFSSRRINPDLKKEKCNKLLHNSVDRLLSDASPIKYKVKAKISSTLKEDASIKGSKLKCWLPLAKNDLQQGNIKIISSSHKLLFVSGENHPSRTVYMEDIVINKPEFELEFQYDISEIKNNIDPTVVIPLKNDMSMFLCEKAPHIEFTYYLRNLAAEIVGSEKNPYLQAKRIYDWITRNIRYSFMSEYRVYENLSQFAAINMRGDCGVQALLFITLCRICGIPARWQSGWYANPINPGSHDWALFYVEPYGWLPVDCSFGGARRNNEAYREFYFGNLDAFRMIANSEFMYAFSPYKKHLRNDPYDNQTGEIETESGPVFPENLDTNIEVICNPI